MYTLLDRSWTVGELWRERDAQFPPRVADRLPLNRPAEAFRVLWHGEAIPTSPDRFDGLVRPITSPRSFGRGPRVAGIDGGVGLDQVPDRRPIARWSAPTRNDGGDGAVEAERVSMAARAPETLAESPVAPPDLRRVIHQHDARSLRVGASTLACTSVPVAKPPSPRWRTAPRGIGEDVPLRADDTPSRASEAPAPISDAWLPLVPHRR